jgi:hypothetical protein
MRGSFFKKEKKEEKREEKREEKEEEKRDNKDEKREKKEGEAEGVEDLDEAKKKVFSKYEKETQREFRQRRVIQGWVNHLLSVAGYNTIGFFLSLFFDFLS